MANKPDSREVLERLKAQETKKSGKVGIFKSVEEAIGEKIIERETIEGGESVSKVTRREDSNYRVIQHAQALLRRLEEIEKKMKSGESYLNYYYTKRNLEKEFLEVAEKVIHMDIDFDNVGVALFEKVKRKREELLKKKA